MTLATPADLKDRFQLVGLTLPSGYTDGKLQTELDRAEGVLLARFRKGATTDLTTNQQTTLKAAEIKFAAAEVQLTLRPNDPDTVRVATDLRNQAFEDVDASRGVPGDKNTRRVLGGLM